MQDVYLIISNYEKRFKVHGVCTKDKAIEQYNLIVSFKPESWIKEIITNFNIKFYSIDEEGNKVFQEQVYLEKRPVMGT